MIASTKLAAASTQGAIAATAAAASAAVRGAIKFANSTVSAASVVRSLASCTAITSNEVSEGSKPRVKVTTHLAERCQWRTWQPEQLAN